MQARRDKGLCYNCDEKFVPGHKCKNQQVYMLETMLELEDVEENKEAATRETQQIVPKISLHELSRVDTPQTMRVRGMTQGEWLSRIQPTSLHLTLQTSGFITHPYRKS
ncbi:hypothetical protein RGQ29_003280 [Quercus rubra]|uniref:Uncharacterized protein n=1 Tax=Quercus rubra TaxID=3512 RepID=A0AAN7EC43_QUERU|nr:hypothetical protein RGQ29_003280 [Quercus rubra]